MLYVRKRDRLLRDCGILRDRDGAALMMHDWASYGCDEGESELAAGALAAIALSDASGLVARWKHGQCGVKFEILDIESGTRNVEAAARHYGIDARIAETLFLSSFYVRPPTSTDVVMRIEALLDLDAEESEAAAGIDPAVRRPYLFPEWERVIAAHNELLAA